MAKPKVSPFASAKKGGMNLAAAGSMLSGNKKKVAKGNPYGPNKKGIVPDSRTK